jgi:predicted DNA-binding transcriptional regulator AlpA
MNEPDRIIRCQEVEYLTGLKRHIRLTLEARGEFPKRIRLSERLTGYSHREVVEWVNVTLTNENLRVDTEIGPDGYARLLRHSEEPEKLAAEA